MIHQTEPQRHRLDCLNSSNFNRAIPVALELLVAEIRRRHVPSPYNIILGRETALPSPLYHSDAGGFDMTGFEVKLTPMDTAKSCPHGYRFRTLQNR
ncbi:hypothetical protein QUB47_13560 [Microcoleus sp. AT9_B5]